MYIIKFNIVPVLFNNYLSNYLNDFQTDITLKKCFLICLAGNGGQAVGSHLRGWRTRLP